MFPPKIFLAKKMFGRKTFQPKTFSAENFCHKKKRRRTRQQHRREMRASSDSWRGASTDRQRRSSVDATSRGTQKVQKHQCLFAACVPAKECGPEEVKCVPHSSNWCSLGTDCEKRSDFCVVGVKVAKGAAFIASMMSLRSRARCDSVCFLRFRFV